jgi:hypothetical protein
VHVNLDKFLDVTLRLSFTALGFGLTCSGFFIMLTGNGSDVTLLRSDVLMVGGNVIVILTQLMGRK